ncbi:MAG: hypothetical protein ACOZCO_02635 [Bacteroidota bacterium]
MARGRMLEKRKTLAQLKADKDFVNYEKLIVYLFNLGYREMPLEMKNLIIAQAKKDVLPMNTTNHTPQPFKSIGVTDTKYATLSNGLFDEMQTTKPIEQYGMTLFDTKKKKITGFASEEPLYNNYNFDPVVFAWNIDPLAAKYPGLSPYSFCFNNPVIFKDPTGEDGRLSITYDKKGNATISLETTVHLYGANASVEVANDLNKKSAALSVPRKFKIDGKVYTVSVKTVYKYSPEIANEVNDETHPERGSSAAPPEMEELSEDLLNKIGYQEGDNMLEINSSISVAGGAEGIANRDGSSGVVGSKNFFELIPGGTKYFKGQEATIHETMHFFTLDERYNPDNLSAPHKGFLDNIMEANGLVKLHPLQYVNIINYALKLSSGENLKSKPFTGVTNGRIEDTSGGKVESSEEEVKNAEKTEIK